MTNFHCHVITQLYSSNIALIKYPPTSWCWIKCFNQIVQDQTNSLHVQLSAGSTREDAHTRTYTCHMSSQQCSYWLEFHRTFVPVCLPVSVYSIKKQDGEVTSYKGLGTMLLFLVTAYSLYLILFSLCMPVMCCK